jgi:riboflavin-specific deaminase-like protein
MFHGESIIERRDSVLGPAWDEIRRARRLWGVVGTRIPVLFRDQAGARITLNPEGTWRADRPIDEDVTTLFDIYLPIAAAMSRGDYAVAHVAQSLDGRTMGDVMTRMSLRDEAGLDHLHRLRSLVDAVVVGAGLVAADDPLLTVRRCSGPHPLRIVIDPTLRLRADRQIFTDDTTPTIVIHRCGSVADWHRDHVERIAIASLERDIAVTEILRVLRDRGARSILVEGGSATITRFLAADAVSRLHLVVSPTLRSDGPNAIRLPRGDVLHAASRRFALGREQLFDLEVR